MRPGTGELPDSHLEVRKRLTALQADNEDLRLQEAEDRAQIDCLVANVLFSLFYLQGHSRIV